MPVLILGSSRVGKKAPERVFTHGLAFPRAPTTPCYSSSTGAGGTSSGLLPGTAQDGCADAPESGNRCTHHSPPQQAGGGNSIDFEDPMLELGFVSEAERSAW